MKQRDGTADALRSEAVVKAIEGSPGGVAIRIIEWGTKEEQRTTLPWRVLRSRQDAMEAAQVVARTRRTPGSSTAVGDALRAGVEAFDDVPCDPERSVIDISGDGANNHGDELPENVRDEAFAEGIVINGLPILNGSASLESYYRENVITPNGFVIAANRHDDVRLALERKLVQEIAEQDAGRRRDRQHAQR